MENFKGNEYVNCYQATLCKSALRVRNNVGQKRLQSVKNDLRDKLVDDVAETDWAIFRIEPAEAFWE